MGLNPENRVAELQIERPEKLNHVTGDSVRVVLSCSTIETGESANIESPAIAKDAATLNIAFRSVLRQASTVVDRSEKS